MKNNNEIARFSLAGVQYSDYQKCSSLKAGSVVTLTWERKNQFDDMAIRVDYQGTSIGYIPKGPKQDLLHELRESGVKVTAYITAYNRNNPTWQMITVGIKANTKNKKETNVRF